jgi:hypothetical protein
LPTYVHDTGGKMDATYRSIPNGQNCISYAGDTPDALADVEAWYQKQMPNATPEVCESYWRLIDSSIAANCRATTNSGSLQ